MRNYRLHHCKVNFVSSSSCAITYHLAHNPTVQRKLHRELDEALGHEDDPVSTFDQVKKLPYLEAVINEALRIHSTSAMGLARLVPEGGLTVAGKTFPEGTVLSVPSYTIHRDREVWGEDIEEFRPERWFEGDQTAIQNTFNPFSFGPRSVIAYNFEFKSPLLIFLQSLCWPQSRLDGTSHNHLVHLTPLRICSGRSR